MPVDNKLTETEKKKTLVNIREFVNATKDFVDVGMYLFARMHPAGAVVFGIAYTIKNLIAAYAIDENDEVMKELKELRTKMDTMLDRMANHFTAFKAFYVENQFWNEVPLRTSVLYQYMLDVQSAPNQKNMDAFIQQYKKHDPLILARKLNYQLDRELMNPLKHAMATDPLMTTKTFVTWQNIIESVFTQLWEIEVKAALWVHDMKFEKIDEIKVEDIDKIPRVKAVQDEINQFYGDLKKWDEEYEKKAYYWPDKVRQFAEDVLEKLKDKPNKEKALAIAHDLDKIHTKAEFYVLVFPDTFQFIYANNRPNQMLDAKRAGCTAIVYRSLRAYKQNDGLLTYATTNLRLYKGVIGDASIDRAPWIQEKHIKAWASKPKTGFRQCGALLAVKLDKEASGVEVAWSTSVLHQKSGCGRYAYGKIDHARTSTRASYWSYYLMFAGYM